jgi:4-hydroxy-tetrahydrodipicolinate synthase
MDTQAVGTINPKTPYPYSGIPGSKAKSWARDVVQGQWIPLMGAVTENDEVDEEGIREGVRQAMKLDIGGLACSSLFEPWSSTHDERRLQLEVFLDEVAGRLPVYATVADHSIKETVRLARHALDHGAAIVTFNCPYEHAKSERQIIAFYEYVCAAVDGPVALYNTPHSGIILSPELVARLAEIENVCAIKNAIGDFAHTSRLFKLVGDQIVVSDPAEKHYLRHIIENNQQALFSTTASHLMQSPTWQPIDDYARAARTGDIECAKALFAEIIPLRAIWEDIYKTLWGGAPGPAEHPIAYAKYWQELMGIPAGPPRPPLSGLSKAQKAAFRARLESTGLMPRFGIEL